MGADHLHSLIVFPASFLYGNTIINVLFSIYRGSVMKGILKEVISKLKSKKDGYCRITHKKGLLGFLEDGDLVFQPQELHQVLKEVISRNSMLPKGEKLFELRRKFNFTVKPDKTPYRPEEALERFITASNPENFFNQIPIGGGKESIDIGIRESDSKFVFIELKPWSSKNSPLYAIVESLKNLIEYRIIHEKQIKEIEHFKEVNLIVLAPQSYYQMYGLIDISEGKASIVKKALNELSSEFDTTISLMELPIEKEAFFEICQKVCNKIETTGQEVISISNADAVFELIRNQWKMVVAADRIS